MSEWGQKFSGEKFGQALERFRGELDKLADMAWTRGGEVWDQFKSYDADQDWSPSVDVVESEDEVLVFVNVPGLTGDEVDITLVGNTLNVAGELKTLNLQDSDRVARRERPAGKFSRTISLPAAVNNESASAHAESGVLKIVMQKTAESKGRKVPVSTAEPSQPAGV